MPKEREEIKKIMKGKKCVYKLIMGMALLGIFLIGCQKEAGQGESQAKTEGSSQDTNKENEDTREETVENTKGNSEESEKKIENINQGINGKVFANIRKLEVLAKKYKKENKENEDSVSLLVAKYLRCSNKNYQSAEWNMLAGYPDEGFEEYVNKNAKKSLASFRDDAVLVDPATGDDIEFSHLMASVNLAIRQEKLKEEDENLEPYLDYGSWGGDLLQLCREIKNAGISSDEWEEEMVSRIGNKNSSFNKDDLYADLDACNMQSFFEREMSLSEAFYSYYYEVLEKSEKTRYQYFYENYFDGDEDESELAAKMKTVFDDGNDAIVIRVLINMQNLNAVDDKPLISTACDAFAKKIMQNQ